MSTQYFTCKEHTVPGQHIRHYAKGTSGVQEEEFELAVKQYTPRDNISPEAGDVTIIGGHASGVPKEVYEPMWDAIYRYTQTGGAFKIRNIWIADIANQGASGVLNEGKLGTEPANFDHARDLLCMVNHFRKDMPRPIVGIGHSLGGNIIINLALMHPRLLSTIIAIEPSLNKNPLEMQYRGAYPLTFKPDLWPSRTEAVKAMENSAFFKSWDPAVFQIYLRYALRDTPTLIHREPGKVTNTTTKHQEVFTYARAAYPKPGEDLSSFQPTRIAHPGFDNGPNRNMQNAYYNPSTTLTYAQLPYLFPSCFYVYGAQTHFLLGRAQGRHDKLSTTGTAVGGSGGHAAGMVAEHVIDGVGHFSCFENPGEVANVCAKWLEKELKRWGEEEEQELASVAGLDVRQRSMVNEDFKWWMREHFGPKKSDFARKESSKSKPKL